MRHITCLILPALCAMLTPISAQEALVAPATAQPVQVGQNDPAEAAWQNLQSQMPQKRPSPSQDAPGQAISQAKQNAHAANRPQQAGDWASIAQQCREYLAQYPDSPHAQEARKMELTAELVPLHGKGGTSPQIESDVEAYLADQSIPAADRFEISSLHKNARLKLAAGMRMEEVMGSHLRDACELADEFPGDPRAWAGVLNFARHNTGSAGADAAQKILNSPTAPEPAKLAAQRLLDRRALIGRPVNAFLEGAIEGRPAMIYFWTYQKPQLFNLLRACGRIEGVTFIGVNVDADKTKARGFATQLALPGAQIYDGPSGEVASGLCLEDAPDIYLVNAQGKFADVDARTNTLARLQQLVAPSEPSAGKSTGQKKESK